MQNGQLAKDGRWPVQLQTVEFLNVSISDAANARTRNGEMTKWSAFFSHFLVPGMCSWPVLEYINIYGCYYLGKTFFMARSRGTKAKAGTDL